MKLRMTGFFLLALFAPGTATGQVGNIDPSEHHSWSENNGWLDFRPVFGGVTVGPYLSGYAWSENAGWMKLGSDLGGPYVNTTATNWGVNHNVVTGALSGFAWSENSGWIRFDPLFGGVTMDTVTSKLSGYAWSENAGWIHFRGTSTVTLTPYGVAVLCSSGTGTVTGGGTICAGVSANVTVTVSGGTPPYTVTLNNGGGTQTGAGPAFTFSVSPSSTTTYAVQSLTDGLACAGVGSGTAVVTVNARPTTPVITAPAQVGAYSPNRTASVPSHVGSSYVWTITNGTITSGQGTSTIQFKAGDPGPLDLSVVETDTNTCASVAGTATVTVLDPWASIVLYTVSPCRVLDTRNPAGPLGGPALSAGQTRLFVVAGSCGVPATARAVSVNVTVTQPVAGGNLTLYPGNGTKPVTSSINFRAGQTRANNAVLRLSTDGAGSIAIVNQSAGSTQVILDVNGYFE